MRHAFQDEICQGKFLTFSLSLPSVSSTNCSTLVGMDECLSRGLFPQANNSLWSHGVVPLSSIYKSAFNPQAFEIHSCFLLRMIAQIGWTLSSTLDYFRTTLNGRSFSIWRTTLQTKLQPTIQSILLLSLDRRTVTDLRLLIQTTQTVG